MSAKWKKNNTILLGFRYLKSGHMHHYFFYFCLRGETGLTTSPDWKHHSDLKYCLKKWVELCGLHSHNYQCRTWNVCSSLRRHFVDIGTTQKLPHYTFHWTPLHLKTWTFFHVHKCETEHLSPDVFIFHLHINNEDTWVEDNLLLSYRWLVASI